MSEQVVGNQKSKKTLYTILKCFTATKEAIKFYDEYSLMMSETKTKAKQNENKGKGLKIFTPKQML